MIETRDLVKVYKPKKGVPVKALDKVSLKFPEKGMVFLLGKSGSGKSTLLNLLGGLDKYNEGDIIIKGVSSKDFKQKHFDSYRNTYVGFIFQEYNILDEFTVGANIALAIELQGRKATDEEVNSILKEVDLEGFGSRRPNELSGGQKQRVAIARALVKKPEIIMADEPTGALDSNTGKQVFDTLKSLSKDKLVIIVSHDREFSELYADRIIELADGKVISDVEVRTDLNKSELLQEENITYKGDVIEIVAGYHITEEDRVAINEYIDRVTDKKTLSLRLTKSKRAAERFVPTNQDAIPTQDGNNFKLIKSVLPMSKAFKIGASSLGHKKIRLVITVLLSVVAFTLFGLSDTFGTYDYVKSATTSLYDSKTNYIPLVKTKRYAEDEFVYYMENGKISKDEAKEFGEKLGISTNGVLTPINNRLEMGQYDAEVQVSESELDIYDFDYSGYVELNDEVLEQFGCELVAGRLPDGKKDEIAISRLAYEVYHLKKYTDGKADANGKYTYTKIESYDDMLGKVLTIGRTNYTVTGIVETGLDVDRYKKINEKNKGNSASNALVSYILMEEFEFDVMYGLSGAVFVGEGHMDRLIKNEPKIYQNEAWISIELSGANGLYTHRVCPFVTTLEDVKEQKIVWFNGEKKELLPTEVLLSKDEILEYIAGEGLDELAAAKGMADFWDETKQERVVLDGFKVVGYIDTDEKNQNYSSAMVLSDSLFNRVAKKDLGEYTHIIGSLPHNKKAIREILEYTNGNEDDYRYEIKNAVIYELSLIDELLKMLSKVFLYVGIGFAIFAAIMLGNFIATSIAYKKHEIGILRAIGSRSNDVFRIFFSEAFVLAMINFVLSAIGVGVITAIINVALREELGILISVLWYGPRQVGLLFLISIGVAFVASFLPVKKIASKKPIEAIRNR